MTGANQRSAFFNGWPARQSEERLMQLVVAFGVRGDMADIQSLINGVKAAVEPITPAKVPITPPALGTDVVLTVCHARRRSSVRRVASARSTRSATVCQMRETFLSATLGTFPVETAFIAAAASPTATSGCRTWRRTWGSRHRNPAWRVERITPMAARRRGRPRSMPPIPTDLPSQLGQFVASVPNPSPTALYTVWAGSNDVLDIANSTRRRRSSKRPFSRR